VIWFLEIAFKEEIMDIKELERIILNLKTQDLNDLCYEIIFGFGRRKLRFECDVFFDQLAVVLAQFRNRKKFLITVLLPLAQGRVWDSEAMKLAYVI